MSLSTNKWGYLRETSELAVKAGIDHDTGLHRTGLNEYLSVIFPEVDDWIHDKTIDTLPKESKCRKRPDYRSESLKLIIEFDGTPHYDSPHQVIADRESTKLYTTYGYKVVRIPFFIQLTNKAVETLFNVEVSEPLFDETIPSFDISGVTPACVCIAGLYRMAEEFTKFPEQYEVNMHYLRKFNDEYLTGANALAYLYNQYISE